MGRFFVALIFKGRAHYKTSQAWFPSPDIGCGRARTNADELTPMYEQAEQFFGGMLYFLQVPKGLSKIKVFQNVILDT